MTEEEARKKWCPLGRISFSYFERNSDLVSGSVNDPQGFRCSCIAPDCAMWVWDGTVVSDVPTAEKVTKHGHCGLAR